MRDKFSRLFCLSGGSDEDMEDKISKIIDITAWVFTAVLFASVFMVGNYSYGKYVIFSLSVAVFALSVVRNGKKAFYLLRPWHLFIIAIAAYSFLTFLWAFDPRDPVRQAVTVGAIGVCFSLPYSYFHNHEDGVRMLLDAVKWGGYIISVYSFFYYGFGKVFSVIIDSGRLENGFCNVNTLGIFAAMSVVITVYEIKLRKKFIVSALLTIPALTVIPATQSKKAFLLIAIGILAVLIVPNDPKKVGKKVLLRALIVTAALAVAGALLIQLPPFEGIRYRFSKLIETLLGQGEDGSSSVVRLEMIRLGLRTFLRHPIGGIGVGCTHIITAAEIAMATYLHNNYVELLAGGGIVGFAVFYSMYGYLIVNFIRKRRVAEPMKNLCIIIVVLLLVMDVALVSYYSKDLYFILMIPFLEIDKLSKKEEAGV